VQNLPLRESYTYLILRKYSLLVFEPIRLSYLQATFLTYFFTDYIFVPTSGHQISIVLWGERAIAFEGDWVLEVGKENPVIAIFVGTLVKNYNGPYTGSCFFDLSFLTLLLQN
jgi:hypothetical protein